MKIFVGNLSFDADEHDLEGLFAAFGHVGKVTLARHPRSRHSRGFGFVEMPDAAEAERAIAALSGREVMGRPLTVNESRQQEKVARRRKAMRRRRS